jgi:hypothetical protein
MSRPAVPLVLMVLSTIFSAGTRAPAEVTAERADGKVVVKIDGQPFAEYLVTSGQKPPLGPIVWPIIGPTGKRMTRNYPMAEGPNERKDHPHHRSLWFNHGDVNGFSFWHKQTIKHRRFVEVESGRQAVIVTDNDWLAPDGKPVCHDQRTLTFHTDGQNRMIDFDITVYAGHEPVKFGDTKEGTFGMRVAGTMKVDAKLGGRIVNSNGQVDGAAWGKRASWVDYHGPVDGQTVGIAILNHPSSFRYPTYWHVRTYGLFAANPFGLHNFKGSKAVDGSYTIPAGGSITFHYRVILHKGDETAGHIAEAFAAYAREKK